MKITNKPFGCGHGYTQENKLTIPFWNIDFEDQTGFIKNKFVSYETNLTIEEFELDLKAGKIEFN